MKKILLLMVGAIVAFAAHADIYLCGANIANSWTTSLTENQWNPSSPLTLSLSDGYYYFTAKGEFKLSTAKGGSDTDWTTFEQSALVVGNNSNNRANWTTSDGISSATMLHEWWGSNNTSPSNDNTTVYYYRIKVDGSTYKIEASQTEFGNSSTVTYQLHGQLTGNSSWETVNMTLNDGKWEYSGDLVAGEFGIRKVENNSQTWMGGGATVTEANKAYSFTGSSNSSSSLIGQYTIVYDPDDKTVTFKGNGGSVNPEKKSYTVYFFNAGTADISGVKAYVWNTANKNVAAWPGEAMTDLTATTAKYVYYNDKYCPVWEYTFTTDINNPSNIIFTGNNMSQTADLAFQNGAFYRQDGVIANGLELVEKPKDDVVTIYMHWKEDFVKKGNGSPYCHVYNDNGDILNTWKSDDQKMYLVSEKYQIWGYDIPANRVAEFNNVIFHFDKDGTQIDEYHAKVKDKPFDQANWTKYIYSTHDGQYAVQTYLSYKEFLAECAKGYPNIYVVGGGDNDRNGMKITVNGQTQDLSWTPSTGVKLDPDTPQDATFYIQLTPKFEGKGSSDAWNARFKTTWMDVASYKSSNGNNLTNDDRDWATFDLGIIGVDDIMVGEKWPGILSVNNNDRHAYFKVNKSMPLLEYNQYDWVLTNEFATSGTTYWAVVDMHDECRTVTLTTFDPNPSVTGEVSSIETETVDFDTAQNKLLSDKLYAAELNGDIYMTKLNKAKGQATIVKAPGSVVDDAGFSVEYTLNLNGVIGTYDNPGTINFDYMPVAADSRQVSVRAKYTDNQTNLTFHSRTGKGNIDLPQATLNAPAEQEFTGYYVYQATNPENGKSIYGVYFEGLTSKFSSSLNAYSDFLLDKGDPMFVHEELPWYEIANEIPYVHAWDQWTADENGMINWSKSLMTSNAPVFIHNVVEVNSIDELTSRTITGEIHAVYPFLFNPNATLDVVPAQAPARAAVNYEGFQVTNTHVSAPLKINVTTDNAVSGIAAVEQEAAADAPVEYYTISGIRVMGEPAPGLYIRRQGDNVTKVVIR